MYALPDKVETLDLPLVIEEFELEYPLEKQFVSKQEKLSRDPALVEDVRVQFLWLQNSKFFRPCL